LIFYKLGIKGGEWWGYKRWNYKVIWYLVWISYIVWSLQQVWIICMLLTVCRWGICKGWLHISSIRVWMNMEICAKCIHLWPKEIRCLILSTNRIWVVFWTIMGCLLIVLWKKVDLIIRWEWRLVRKRWNRFGWLEIIVLMTVLARYLKVLWKWNKLHFRITTVH